MTGAIDGTWSFYRGDERVADLVVTEADFPWLRARAEPRRNFEKLTPLFAEDLRLVEILDEDHVASERACRAIREAVTLRYPDGRTVPEFLLHVDGDQAWWRWSDEMFEDHDEASPS